MNLWSLPMILLGAVLGLGCRRADLPSLPTLVVTDPDAEINAWPLSATRGMLEIDENCIKLNQGADGPEMVTLVFPPGYKLRQFKQGWAITTSRADIWGVVGTERQVGGGSLGDGPSVSHYISVTMQQKCRGPYWLVLPEDPVELQPRNVRPLPPSVDG